MIIKVNLEEFKNKINEFRQKNGFKMNNAMTDRDKEYYNTLGLGFERAIAIVIACAEFEIVE